MTATEIIDFAMHEKESLADLAEMIEHMFTEEEEALETVCRNILDAIEKKRWLSKETVH